MRKSWLVIALGLAGRLLSGSSARAAVADSTAVRRPIGLSPERAVAYSLANDAPFRTDYYFTQGMSLALVLPWFGRLPTRRLLLGTGLPEAQNQYGVRVRYDGFTPLRIQDPFIRLGDRPYASYIYATLFHSRTSNAARRTAGLQLGVIGPAAGAKGFQTAIHRWIDAPTPRGWDFQVRNDVVLGYEIGEERQLLTVGQGLVEVIGTARAALSTLRTVAGGGLVVRAGWSDPYFSTVLGVSPRGARAAGRRAVQVYTEGRAEAQAIGYDATMQGGLLHRTSPYTLPASAVRRVVGQATGALVLAAGGISTRLAATWVTPEIRAGRSHAWAWFEVRAAF